ncbi:MAG: B12-binding domain-containing radical SAM protein [Planctomycetes bacterium]|nr:B12-binding domain-containing radical SAM protein [Planctomycetota bacterium]
MIGRKKKIVLYQPAQVDETLGLDSSKDLLPLEMLTIAAWPLADGYEVVIVDGSITSPAEAHRKVLEACEGALLYATTGILGYMVFDGLACSRKVRARFPDLAMVIGGWFASVRPDLQLTTGLYQAVVLGQGELTFRDLVLAIDAGTPLEQVPGLALLRDGQLVKTEKRAVAGWDKVLNCPWGLLDIEPYRRHQLRAESHRDVLRMPTPRAIGERKPYFGVTYVSSYGCPEPCTFCCSPFVTDRRWKSMPADRMLDDIQEMHERWGFQVLRFHDANFGVMEKRTSEFCQGLVDRKLGIWWNSFIETHSILHYQESTRDLLAASGMYVAEIGAEAGTDAMMAKIGKPIHGDDNVHGAVELDKRGICANLTYIIGYPGESKESMLATIDQCRRVHVAAPLSRATVWPFRPIPGTAMWDQAITEGYVPPTELESFGSLGQYHLEETWLGRIPEDVMLARKMYHHYATLDYGLARGKIGWWEKRAKRRLARGELVGGFPSALTEARAFDLYHRITRKLFPKPELSRSWVDPGHKTGTKSTAASESKEAMTETTAG